MINFIYFNNEIQKLIKIILLEVRIKNLKIRLRDNNCYKSANSKSEL